MKTRRTNPICHLRKLISNKGLLAKEGHSTSANKPKIGPPVQTHTTHDASKNAGKPGRIDAVAHLEADPAGGRAAEVLGLVRGMALNRDDSKVRMPSGVERT